MKYSSKNKAALMEYNTLATQYYKEPVDGKYEDITSTILDSSATDSDCSEQESVSEVEELIYYFFFLSINFKVC